MAWTCVRCLKRFYAPRDGAYRYAMEYHFNRTKSELSYELKKLQDLSEKSVVTHLDCEFPEVQGMSGRLRQALKIPKNVVHPLLD